MKTHNFIITLLLIFGVAINLRAQEVFAKWPDEAFWRPYTYSGQPNKDNKIQDPSNGGTSPQSYANISSGNPDLNTSSFYYAMNPSQDTVFIRFRLESTPVAYSGGATYANADPFQSITWTFLIDVNGDGWRDFAITMDGGSGGPSNYIDDLRVVYSTLTTTQSVDPANPDVKTLTALNTAEISGNVLAQYDGTGHQVTGPMWPNGRYTTQYDFGRTRVTDATSTNNDYIVDIQIPIDVLDATAYGGPKVTKSTPISVSLSTANSNVNPFQKDIAYLGVLKGGENILMPGSDFTSFDGTTSTAPIVTQIITTPCPNVTLTAKVAAAFRVVGGLVTSTVDSVKFYYWNDANVSGDTTGDSGSSWVYIGNGTMNPVGTWTSNWNSSSSLSGFYLIKAIAYNNIGQATDSYYQNVGIYGRTYGTLSNSCGTLPPNLEKRANVTSVISQGNVYQRNIVYTAIIHNTGTASVTLDTLFDVLPTSFTYRSDTTGGSLTPTTSPAPNSTGTIFWRFSPARTIPAGGKDSLKFNVYGGNSAGTYYNTLRASGSLPYISAENVAPVTVTDAAATLYKSASTSGTLTRGQTFSYTINYQNTGSVELTRDTLYDVLPSGLNFVSATNSGSYDSQTRTVKWALGTLTVGQSGSVSVTVTVSDPFAGTSPLSNSAYMKADELPATVISNSTSHTVVTPLLTITNTATPVYAVGGAYITYTINYGNIGTGPATYDTITAVIPDSLSLVTGTISVPAGVSIVSTSSNLIKFAVASISAGSTNNIITYQALVKTFSAPIANFNQVNTAYIKSNETALISDTALTIINSLPSVTVRKEANPYLMIGATNIRYKLTFKNEGTQPARITSIIDSLPSGFTYVNGTTGGMVTGNPTNGATTGRLVWTPGTPITLNPGVTDTVGFNVTSSAIAGTYTNAGRAYGTVSGTSSTDSVTGRVNVIVNASGQTAIYKSVDKVAAYQGDTITYTITFRNDSTSNFTGLNITDVLPPYVRYLSYTVSGSAATGFTKTVIAGSPVTRDSLIWPMTNPYGAGSSSIITVKVIDSSGTPNNTILSNDVRAWAKSGQNYIIKRISETVNTISYAAPNITFTKSVSQTSAPVNTMLTYTLNYSNASTAGPSTNTIIIDTLPTNVWYKPGSATNGGAFDSNATAKRIAWNLGKIDAGVSGSVSFQVYINSGATGSVNNTARLYNNELKNRVSTVSTTIAAAPILSLTKTVDKTLAAPGDTLTYILTLQNSSTTTAATVDTLFDQIPTNTLLVSTTPVALTPPNIGDSTGTVKWFVNTLNANSSYVCTLKVRIKKPLAIGSVESISNYAWNRSNQIPNTTSNTVNTTITYPQQTVSKSVDKGTASPGDTLTYTISVTNNSLVSVTADTLIDVIPANSTYISTTGNVGSLASAPSVGGTGTVKWAIGTLAANGTATVTLKVKANSPLDNSTKINNTASLTTDMTNTVVNSNSVTTTISSAPNLSISKYVDKATASAGDTLRYTIIYRNMGNANAPSYQLLDPIPSNTSFVLGSLVQPSRAGSSASYNPLLNRIVVTVDTLKAGTSDSIKFRVKINSILPYGSNTIINTASASSANATSTTGSVTTTTSDSSILNIYKSGPTSSDLRGTPPTDTVTYTISYNIGGTAAADSVYINEPLPANMLYLSSSPVADVKPMIGSNGIVKWNLGTLNPGTSGQVNVTVTTTTSGTFRDSATITSKQNVNGKKSNTVVTDISAPHNGAIEQTPTRYPGQTITITVTDADLKNEGVIFVRAYNTRTDEEEYTGLIETAPSSGIFVGTVGTEYGAIAGSDNNGFFNVQAGDTIRTLYVDMNDASDQTVNRYSTTLILGGFTGTIIGTPNPVTAGDTVTFTLTDLDLNYNTSSVESYNLQVVTTRGETETLTFVETGVNTGIFKAHIWTVYGTGPGPNGNDTLTVLPGDSIRVTYLDSLTTPGGKATNIAAVLVSAVDFSTSQKTWTDKNGGNPMPPDTISYKIKIINTGGRATSISVIDTIPNGVTVLTSTLMAGATVNDRVITFQSFVLPPSNIDSIEYSVRIDSTIQNGVPATNIVHILVNGADQKLTASFTPVNQPILKLNKFVDKSHALPGDTLNYTITFRNIGTSAATSVIVFDANPPNTTYIPNSTIINGTPKTDKTEPPNVGEVTYMGGSLQINIGVLMPGEYGNIIFKVIIN